jgi:hypothetical protein
MKKKNGKRLRLASETLRRLDEDRLRAAIGGMPPGDHNTIPGNTTWCTNNTDGCGPTLVPTQATYCATCC